jgi:hypothetical protein
MYLQFASAELSNWCFSYVPDPKEWTQNIYASERINKGILNQKQRA